MDRDKKSYRKLKREVKRAGNKKRRAQLKRDLVENPTEAHWSEADVGQDCSANLNGLDNDATRRRPTDREE